jgi:hypothetical protein
VGFFERDRPTPISYQYNLNIQKELPANTVVEIGYMANVSHHLTANDLSINQVAPHLMGPGDSQARRPFPQFSNVFILNPAVGNSTYHAGFAKAEKRYSAGFSLLAHYTFSKFIDDVASSNEYGDPASYMDAYNRRLDKSLSGSDVPHRVVLSGLYEPKYLHGWKFGVYDLAVGRTVYRDYGSKYHERIFGRSHATGRGWEPALTVRSEESFALVQHGGFPGTRSVHVREFGTQQRAGAVAANG